MNLSRSIVSAMFLTLMAGSVALAQPATDAPKHQPGDKAPANHEGQPREGGPRGGMGRQLSADKAKAAWALEAKAVAARHNLSADQTTALVKAYEEARSSVMAKQEEARKNRAEGDPSAAMKSVREAETAAREKFTKALTDAKITGDNATKVNASLGSMGMVGMGWDRMVDSIAGMNLPAAKQQQAMNAIEDFAIANGKMANNMRDGNGDPKEARTASQANRETLTTAMKGVLSAEQMTEFEKTMGGGREGRRGGDDAQPGDKPAPKGKK